MNEWFRFWMTIMGVSFVLFFGVAVLVALNGWRDLWNLYQRVSSKNPDQSQSNT